VDIEFGRNTTTLYVNGQPVKSEPSDFSVGEIIGRQGGFLYIGRSTRGTSAANGEYFTGGEIANYKIYKLVPPNDAAKVAAAREALSLPYGVDRNEVYGNITLPKTGLYDTTITWQTSHPSIVNLNEYPKSAGVVTRPYSDTIVTMTATISSGSVSENKTIFFTVKKAPPPVPETRAYLYAHFTGSTKRSTNDEQVYFAISEDGLVWKDTRPNGSPILLSDKGDRGTRDPYFIRVPEGDKFYLIATDLSFLRRELDDAEYKYNASTKIAVWESTDLVNWSDMWLVDVASGIQNAGMAWAPEAVYDDTTGDYFLFWSTYVTGETLWYARTRDFRTITTTPKQWVNYNAVIDATAIKSTDGNWYRALANWGNKIIAIDKATSLEGPWTRVGDLQTYFTGAWSYGTVEGPELILYNRKDWNNPQTPLYAIYVDRFQQGTGVMAFFTSDLSSTSRPPWTINTNVDMGLIRKRHGGFLAVTTEEYNRIERDLTRP
jgi:hypothetical protein